MSWKEVSPGRYERPLDQIETFMKVMMAGDAPDRQHFTISAVVRLTVDLPGDQIVSALREAWKTTRYDYPNIASRLSDSSMVYETPNPTALEAWLAETLVVTSSPTTAGDLIAHSHPPALATLHYLPHTSELVFRSSHWRIDGVGVLYLLDRFLQALGAPREIQFGNEHVRLSASLEQAVPVSVVTTPETEQMAEKMFHELISGVPSVGFETSPADLPGGTRRRALRFSEKDTAAILAACKARGFGITATTHAALVVATQELASQATRGRPFTTLIPVNLRPYLASPFNTTDHAVGVYMTGIPVSLPPADFGTYVVTLQGLYSRDRSPPKSPFLSALPDWVRRTTAMLSQPLPEGMAPPSGPDFNSLGLVDRYIRQQYGERVHVEGFYLMVEMVNRQVEVYLWTSGGQLELSVCFNEAFYQGDFMQQFLDMVKGTLLKELGLSVS